MGMSEGEKSAMLNEVVIKRDDPLIDIMEGKKQLLTRYDLMEDPQYKEVSDGCVAQLNSLNASLIFPLVFQDKLIGMLSLGEKKSGKTYNSEDIELLRTLASQGAVAIENARLFQENLEKQRMEEELNIARDLQMSMLPASCPEIADFQIAAFAEPAREVGGDFYDFVETKGGGLGFVIGDVTGKSVSGALVMSASRSIFRMLSEEDLSVSEIMIRANRRAKKDIKPGMFVALLYAVLNPENKTLRLCSAGQTQPVYISAKSKSAQLIETVGDTFPLGILDDVEYAETKIDISAGDKVVFYTDGIVEAMNKENEVFGFDRLLEAAKENWNQPAAIVLKAIIDQVNQFSEGMAQHDDLTVIVISVNEGSS
jgi:serine phosphatase RsbU (regulator of sigma subunit)